MPRRLLPLAPRSDPPLPFVVGLIPLGLAIYWGWTYTGLYRWLAQRQLEFLGRYAPELTFLLTLLILMLPLLLVVWMRSAQEQRSTLDPQPQEERPKAPSRKQWRDSWRSVTDVRRWSFVSGILGMMLIGLSLRDLAGLRDAPATRSTVPELARQSVFQAQYVEVVGLAEFTAAVSIREGEATAWKAYVPLLASTAAPNEKPVASVLLDAPQAVFDRWAAHASEVQLFRGIARVDWIPGAVTDALRGHGFEVPNAPTVVYLAETPAAMLHTARVMSAIGVGFLGLTALLWWWRRRGGVTPR